MGVIMCPSCGDAMYPNGLSQVMSNLDYWHCYSKDCGAMVLFKFAWTIFGEHKEILDITHFPEYITLDEELERMATNIFRWRTNEQNQVSTQTI